MPELLKPTGFVRIDPLADLSGFSSGPSKFQNTAALMSPALDWKFLQNIQKRVFQNSEKFCFFVKESKLFQLRRSVRSSSHGHVGSTSLREFPRKE